MRRLSYGKNSDTIDLIYDYAADKLSVRWNDSIKPKFTSTEDNNDVYLHLTANIAYNWKFNILGHEVFNAIDNITNQHKYQLDI